MLNSVNMRYSVFVFLHSKLRANSLHMGSTAFFSIGLWGNNFRYRLRRKRNQWIQNIHPHGDALSGGVHGKTSKEYRNDMSLKRNITNNAA